MTGYNTDVSLGRRAEQPTMPTVVVDRLFVYGTLRTGQRARRLVEEFVRSVEPGTCAGSMYDFPAGYPGIVLDGMMQIVGEIVHLADLPAALPLLDAYEGDEFTRVLTEVEGPAGKCWCWVYVLADPELTEDGTLVASGDWASHVAR